MGSCRRGSCRRCRLSRNSGWCWYDRHVERSCQCNGYRCGCRVLYPNYYSSIGGPCVGRSLLRAGGWVCGSRKRRIQRRLNLTETRPFLVSASGPIMFTKTEKSLGNMEEVRGVFSLHKIFKIFVWGAIWRSRACLSTGPSALGEAECLKPLR